MTMPDEEIRALTWARDLLNDLAYGWHWNWKGTLPNSIPATHRRVPKSVRLRARSVLRHYPGKSAILAYWKRSDSSPESPRSRDRKPVRFTALRKGKK